MSSLLRHADPSGFIVEGKKDELFAKAKALGTVKAALASNESTREHAAALYHRCPRLCRRHRANLYRSLCVPELDHDLYW